MAKNQADRHSAVSFQIAKAYLFPCCVAYGRSCKRDIVVRLDIDCFHVNCSPSLLTAWTVTVSSRPYVTCSISMARISFRTTGYRRKVRQYLMSPKVRQ